MSTSNLRSGEKPYHHGHLHEALVEAALAAARAEGPGAVVLRAVTRAAGVSPNAAYRHFADRDDLLRAVAVRCQEQMADLMRARLEQAGPLPGPDGAWRRLRVAGHAYVEFALTEPGWFATAFAIPLGPAGAPDDEPGLSGILTAVLDGLVRCGAIAPAVRPGAEYVAWSAVHGIASLLTSGALRDLPPAEKDAAIERVINAVAFLRITCGWSGVPVPGAARGLEGSGPRRSGMEKRGHHAATRVTAMDVRLRPARRTGSVATRSRNQCGSADALPQERGEETR